MTIKIRSCHHLINQKNSCSKKKRKKKKKEAYPGDENRRG